MRENSEEWMQLCEQAASEHDPEQLMMLVEPISVLLEAREQRLRDKGPSFDLPPKFPKEAGPQPNTAPYPGVLPVVPDANKSFIKYCRLGGVLPGLADLPIKRLPELTPSVRVAQHPHVIQSS